RVPGAPDALRGLRPAGARGDGVRDACRRASGRGGARGRGRCGALRRAAGAGWRGSPGGRGARTPRRRRPRARPALLMGRDRAPDGRGVPRRARLPVKVAAVVVSHGHAHELETLLPALAPQVDELLVVQNLPEPAPPLGRALANPRPLSYAANANRG